MEELEPSLAAALRPRVERLGYLGEFFCVTGNQPAALLAFYELTEALKEALPDGLTETVALTVATMLDNAYERNQHERLALKQGQTSAWIAEVERLAPDESKLLERRELAVQRLVIEAVSNGGKHSRDHVEALVAETNAKTAVAVLMLVGRYASHALIVNALELAPPVPSIFAAEPVR